MMENEPAIIQEEHKLAETSHQSIVQLSSESEDFNTYALPADIGDSPA